MTALVFAIVLLMLALGLCGAWGEGNRPVVSGARMLDALPVIVAIAAMLSALIFAP